MITWKSNTPATYGNWGANIQIDITGSIVDKVSTIAYEIRIINIDGSKETGPYKDPKNVTICNYIETKKSEHEFLIEVLNLKSKARLMVLIVETALKKIKFENQKDDCVYATNKISDILNFIDFTNTNTLSKLQ